jgi:carboxypeptidase C (cathepsin A)
MTKDNEKNASAESAEAKMAALMESEPEPVVTEGRISLGGETVSYTATTGRLPVKNDKGEIEALLFFTAYTRTDAPKHINRPLTIAFNGGPGSSSVWLHMGALGPKMAAMNPDGSLPPPPYTVSDNAFTWLDETDLLFIDPPGTGYSRTRDEETAKKFYGVEGDIQVLGEFIRLYLTRYQRWHSPLFLSGESYGTTRAAGLAGHLTEKGIVFRGIILISTVLNFQTIIFGPGNDLPYALFLPTYAATAWYHGKLSDSWQSRALSELLQESETFAEGEYTSALMKGDRLSIAETERVAHRVAELTGISADYVKRSALRVPPHQFRKELRRDEGILVGRLDSRLTGREGRGNSEAGEYDPAMSAIRPPYTAIFNAYVRDSLKFETDLPYEILGGLYSSWDWGKNNHYADTANALRSAMVKNPHLRVLNAAGYYDLATPHFAAEYTFSHLDLDPALRQNVHFIYYEAGHMMYIEDSSLEKLKKDVADFLLR